MAAPGFELLIREALTHHVSPEATDLRCTRSCAPATASVNAWWWTAAVTIW
ncbi:hypothetical protein ACIPPR_30750 [Streptomyces nigra]|uniref:hypothetical protein n=1 Tax=Streptomyces nigra TaxID=1827580 RepID=UPI0037FA82B2